MEQKQSRRLFSNNTPLRTKICPLDDGCLWKGVNVLGHLKDSHPECIINTNTFELNLKENYKMKCVLNDDGREFLLRMRYHCRSPNIQINLTEFDSNIDVRNKYTIYLYSSDFKKRFVSQIEDAQCVIITQNMYEIVSSENIIITISVHDIFSKISRAILSALECPICMETINTPNIRMCKTGHSFCQVCFDQLSQCPLCQDCLTNTANYALMQLRTEIFRFCKNKNFGCNFQGFSTLLLKHEASCHSYYYKCPFKDCEFKSEQKKLIQHFLDNHKINETDGHFSCNLCDIRDETKKCIYVRLACGNIFQVHKKLTGDDVFLTVKLFDSKEEAEQYIFFIEIEKERKVMLFSDVCKSITDETDIVENGLHISLKPFNNISRECAWQITITKGKRTS